MRAVQHVQLQLDRRQPVAELRLLGAEDLLVDLLVEPHVEQAILLSHQQRRLPLKLAALGAGIRLGVARLRCEHGTEPVADLGVLDPHPVEQGEYLAIYVGLSDAMPWMALGLIAAAPVVDVLPDAVLGPLADALAGDRPAAMAAGHELARVGHFVRAVHVAAEKRLHAVPRRAID